MKRNTERFTEQFGFQLTNDEKVKLVTNCDRFNALKLRAALKIIAVTACDKRGKEVMLA